MKHVNISANNVIIFLNYENLQQIIGISNLYQVYYNT